MSERLQSFSLGEYRVHPRMGTVDGPAGSTRLEPRAMELLVYLASRSGEVVSHEDIIRAVWRRALVTDAVISQSIYQIRRALADHDKPSRVINTVPKRGYRLSVPPVFPEGPTVEPGPQAVLAGSVDLPPSSAAGTLQEPRTLRVALIGACAAIAVLALAFVSLGGRSSERAAEAPTPTRLDEPYPLVSQAPVLLISPFATVGDHDPPAYIAAGLTEELINAAARIEGLRVLGRSSASRLHELRSTGEAITPGLRLDYELEGTVRPDEQRVTIAVRVRDVRANTTLHEQIYEVAEHELATAPARIATELAVRLQLLPPPTPAGAERHVPTPEAYRLYLEGRYYSLSNTPGGLEQGIDYFRQAIAVDPQFALAHAGTAILQMLRVDFGALPLEQATRAAEPAARQALALDPDLAEAHGARGLIDFYNGSLISAADSFRRATALRPNYTQGHMWLGRLLYQQGSIHRSLAAFERAYALEPLSAIVAINLFLALHASGRLIEAQRVADHNLRLNPSFANGIWAVGLADHLLGNLQEARSYYQRAAERAPELGDAAAFFSQYARLQLQLGDPDGAHEALRRAELIDPTNVAVLATRLDWEFATRAPRSNLAAPPSVTAAQSSDAARLLIDGRREYQAGRALQALQLFNAMGDSGAALMRDRWEALAGRCGLIDWAAAALEAGDAERGTKLLEEAEVLLDELRRDGMRSGGLDYLQATVHSLRGDRERAMAHLANPAVRYQPGTWWIALDRRMTALQARAEFRALLERAPATSG